MRAGREASGARQKARDDASSQCVCARIRCHGDCAYHAAGFAASCVFRLFWPAFLVHRLVTLCSSGFHFRPPVLHEATTPHPEIYLMGLLVEGVWRDIPRDTETKKTGGQFVRKPSQFRNWVTADGSPGPSGKGGFPAEAGRYHLFVSLACPWAHRTLIFRKLKKLEDIIGVSVVDPAELGNGWEFNEAYPDPLYGLRYYYELYRRADPDYSGRVTVPALWDKQRETIVTNESSEIIRMLNSAFDGLTDSNLDFYPEPLRGAIDAINDAVYTRVNNGVYRTGFATSQEAYEEAFTGLFQMLDELDDRLASQRYLVGNRLTEADWRLFTTLIRFDAVYFGHYKCNLRRIADYANLSGYVRDLYQVPGIKKTVDIEQIKRHYYFSHVSINPTRIVPLGPVLDFDAPHGRDRFPAEGRPG
jgi:putative glutathione S-transferase